MRRFALLLLFGLSLTQAGGAATNATRYLPVDMRFLDAAHGFVRLEPVLRCRSCRPRIERTDDGGRRWRTTSLARLPLPPAESRFRATWRTGSRRTLQLAAVVGPSVAWATSQSRTGAGSQLFVSRDGGRSWGRVKVPCGRPLAFYRPLVAAVSARHAWLLCLGQPGAGQQNKALYETADGRTWRLRRSLSGSGYGLALAFASKGFGLLAESRGGVLVTRDGGRTWRLASMTSPEIAEPQAIDVLRPAMGLVLVRDDRSGRALELYRTRKAGPGWDLVHVWR